LPISLLGGAAGDCGAKFQESHDEEISPSGRLYYYPKTNTNMFVIACRLNIPEV
jgi:hypothetical protein